MNIKRGDIYYADLNPVIGSEQGGTRPVLVIQNNMGNRLSETIIVAAVSSVHKRSMPIHADIADFDGLPKDSVVLAEQIRTIDRSRLKDYVGSLDKSAMEKVNTAIKISLGVMEY